VSQSFFYFLLRHIYFLPIRPEKGDRMKDPEAERARIAAYQRMSPAQKYAEFVKMQALARDLKRAGVKSLHPDWSDKQVDEEVRKIFLYATT
jgi:hypothetical protein